MTTPPVQFERRAAQRFDFNLPVSVRVADDAREGLGFTQNLTARGAFFYTDLPLVAGSSIELTLVMPSEITLTESMRVRCRGRVQRVVRPAVGTADGTKLGVAAHIEAYEYLPEIHGAPEGSAAFSRISALHEHPSEDEDQDTVAHGAAVRRAAQV